MRGDRHGAGSGVQGAESDERLALSGER